MEKKTRKPSVVILRLVSQSWGWDRGRCDKQEPELQEKYTAKKIPNNGEETKALGLWEVTLSEFEIE